MQDVWHSQIFSVALLGLIPLGQALTQFVPSRYKLPNGQDKQSFGLGPLQLRQGDLQSKHSPEVSKNNKI